MAHQGRSQNASGGDNSLPALSNLGYFSDYYLAYRLETGLSDLYEDWTEAEKEGSPTPRTRLRKLSAAFSKHRAGAALTAPSEDDLDWSAQGELKTEDLPADGVRALLALNDSVLD